MIKKIFAIMFLLTSIIVLLSTFNSSYAAVNEIRNFIGGAENTIENVAGNAAGMIRNGTNTMSGAMDNMIDSTGMNNNDTNNEANTGAITTNQNTTNGNYTAQRTATTGDVTVMGISANVWTWIIIAITIVGIVTLLWSYFTQRNHHNDSDYYNE